MTGEPRYPYVHLDVLPADVDVASARLFDLGAEGVEERDEGTLARSREAGKVTLVCAFASREIAEEAITQIDASLAPRYEEIVGDAWHDAWKKYFHPFAIADGLVVRPPWEPYEAARGERVLELEPGRAFGTGLHETTRLVAQALQKRANEVSNATVLDVGCGSGILALVALALGAKRAVAIDTDPDAICVTRENAARNGMTVEASTTPLRELDLHAPVVFANIEAHVLISMATELERHVAPSGLLLLSGILLPLKNDVLAAYSTMSLLDAPEAGEWILLAFRGR